MPSDSNPESVFLVEAVHAMKDLLAASDEGALRAVLGTYRALLETIDQAYRAVPQSAPCACEREPRHAACCRGLFEVSILDALLLRSVVRERSVPVDALRLSVVGKHLKQAGLPFPYWVGLMAPDERGDADDALDALPCVLLDETERCMVYADRPAVCRFQGAVFHDPPSGLTLEDECPARVGASPEVAFDFASFHREEARLFECLRHLAPALPDDPGEMDVPLAAFLLWDDAARA